MFLRRASTFGVLLARDSCHIANYARVLSANPDRCNDAPGPALTYKGYDATECCPVQTGRSCGLTPCPSGEYAGSVSGLSRGLFACIFLTSDSLLAVNDVCTKCMGGKFNPGTGVPGTGQADESACQGM